MVTVKKGRYIKARNSSHCKVLKYAKKKEYDALDWDRNAQAAERTMLDVYPDSPSKDPPPSLPEMEVVGDPHQTTCGRDSEGPRELKLPRGTLCIGTLCRAR